MVMLRVRRSLLELSGRVFRRGETIESREFRIDQGKWAQLIDHRYVDLVDKPGDLDEATRDEIAAVLRHDNPAMVAPTASAWIGETGPETVLPIHAAAGTAAPCSECGFVAKTAHGLTIHMARKHSKKE